jgi:hypothetical protein
MNIIRSTLVVALGFALTGCGKQVNPDVAQEVEVSGKVVGPDGQPLTNVMIGFAPTGGAAAANAFPLGADGSFKGTLRAGKYSYAILPLSETDKKSEAVLKKLPDSYKATTLDRQIDVSGGALELKF